VGFAVALKVKFFSFLFHFIFSSLFFFFFILGGGDDELR